MESIADNLSRILQTKKEIRDVLISKGKEVSEDLPFKDYVAIIDSLKGDDVPTNPTI